MTSLAVSQGDRRRFAVLLGVLGVLVAVFVGRMVFAGGGGAHTGSMPSE
jgi:hypothetical protein